MAITIRPLADAAARISEKTPVGSVLRTAEWSRVPLALRERAFFSAGVESARFLSDARQGVLDVLNFARENTRGGEALIDRSSLIAKLREVAKREGIPVDPKKAGGLQDITSRARLALILDTQLDQAREFARWKAEQDPDILDAFPAQELVRIESRDLPRKWTERWVQHGGKLYAGRMIAAKGDPIWSRISRFGTPWPPFDFRSGMGIEDISRDEAEALGVIAPGQIIPPGDQDFNAGLEASARGLGEIETRRLKGMFGDQVRVDGDKAQWVGNLIGDLFDKATADKKFKGRVSLGQAWPEAVQAADEAGEDIAGYEFDLSADDIRHAIKSHGGESERARGQRPVTKADFECLPFVLRQPDVVGRGQEPDALGMTKTIDGKIITFWLLRSRKNKRANLKTLYIREEKK